eukprot:TRINITY_DN14108_c0_g1_i1.p1 TRINITY_DN14108_c0_g1~~TRINITY_DN14108_c0_g1_i1.p1  ORF type:complete len:198 (-),score=24.77 TRINITY_DN14108_c0_g1_i1:25-591(-)
MGQMSQVKECCLSYKTRIGYAFFCFVMGVSVLFSFTCMQPSNYWAGAYGLISGLWALGVSIFYYCLMKHDQREKSQMAEVPIPDKSVNEENLKPLDTETLLPQTTSAMCSPIYLITIFSVSWAFSLAFFVLMIYYLVYAGVHHQSGSSLASGWVTAVWAFMSAKWSFGLGFAAYHHFRKTTPSSKFVN